MSNLPVRINRIEKSFLAFGLALFFSFFYMYITNFNLRRTLFGSDVFSGREKIGVLGQKQGDFKRKMMTGPSFKNLQEKSDLYNHDMVVTGDAGSATLELFDGSVLELGPKTMLKLSFDSEFALRGIGRRTTINIVSGKVKAQSRKDNKNIVVKVNNQTKAVLNKVGVADVIEVPENTITGSDLKFSESALNLPPASPLNLEATSQVLEVGPTTPFQIDSAGQVVGVADPLKITGKATETKMANGPLQIAAEATVVEVKPSAKPSAKASNIATIQAIPEVTVSAKAQLLLSVRMKSPSNRSKLRVPKGAKKIVVPIRFQWSVYPAGLPVNLSIRRKVVQSAFKRKRADGATVQMDDFDEILNETIVAQGRNYEKRFVFEEPGQYEWEIVPKDEEYRVKGAQKIRSFEIPKFTGGLSVNDPLIAGQKGASNRYMGKVLKDFDVTLNWEKKRAVNTYHVRFFRSPSGGTPFFDKQVSNNSFTLGQKDIPKGRITYFEVVASHDKGFFWKSKRRGFRFDFSPPYLKYPKNNSRVSWELLRDEDFLEIFTWERTNFTLKYDVEVSKDPNFSKLIYKKSTANNFTNVPLKTKGIYYWRVKAVGKSFSSVPSPTRRFVVK